MYKFRFLALLFFGLFLASCQTPTTVAPSNPKYVFLFIGDGMGVNQVYATELFLGADSAKLGGNRLQLNRFPVNSDMTTFSANSYVTCSSASGTALSTGYKTNNGMLNMSPDSTQKYETLAFKAKNAGFKVGILSSVSIDHATPACFYAHQPSRNNYYEISMELPNYGIDYFGGGGFEYPTGRDKDQPNAFDNAVNKGYKLINTAEAFGQISAADIPLLCVNPKTYTYGEFYWEIDQVEGSISLADFTQKGIEVLDNDKGFFMMVEGGKIDWACHSNDGAAMIHEVIAFDAAVAKAYEFYLQHPDETLIIVTADHETASLFTGFHYSLSPGLLKHQKISLQEFTRKLENTKTVSSKISFDEVMQLIKADFGLGDSTRGLALSQMELQQLRAAYEREFVQNKAINPDANYMSISEEKTLAELCVSILNTRAGLGWGTQDHSAMPVPIRVIGNGQNRFCQQIDNTDVPKIIGELMGF